MHLIIIFIGTGTPVGDFTEATSLGTFFRKHAPNEILIGSVKTNIGHLEAGAGIVALIKVLLMMKNEELVPSLHAEPLNSKIPFSDLKLKVCLENSTWLQNDHGSRIASINCFGFGGTNAHAVISDYQAEKKQNTGCPDGLHLCLQLQTYVILSAKDMKALHSTAKHMMDFIKENVVSLSDLASTSVHFRSHYRYRKVFAVDELKDLVIKIDQFIKDQESIKRVKREKPNVVFVYCGVGTTWQKMCKVFITHDDVFRKSMKEIDHHLSSFTDISVQSIFENEEDVSDPLKSHLAIFACQIGLTEMWKYVGVSPDIIVGKSVGEVAAAYACHNLSLKDAVKVIYFRSLNLAKETSGKMILIQNCDVKIIKEHCSKLQNGKAKVAVYHSSVSCAVSGDTTAIDELQTKLPKFVKFTPLNVKCAYHSHLTIPAALELEKSLKDLKYKNPSTTVISTVTGQTTDENFGSAKYWSKNVSDAVLFYHAIQKAKQQSNGDVIFLEIGPKPVLKAHLPNIFPDSFGEALASMKKNSEIETFQTTFLDLFVKGVTIEWEHVVPKTKNILQVPQYQFSKRKHLAISENMKAIQNGHRNTASMMFLSQVPGNEDSFSMLITKENTPFIYDHVVDGSVVVPGSLYGAIALEIGHIQMQESFSYDLNVSWSVPKAFLVSRGEHVIVVETKHETKQALNFSVYTSDTSSPLSSGTVTLVSPGRANNLDISRIISILDSDGDRFITYLALEELGFEYGPMFKTITKIAVRKKEIICEVFIPDKAMKEVQKTYLHPIIIDTMIQSTVGTQLKNRNLSKERALPVKISQLIVRQRPQQRMICYTIPVTTNAVSSSFNILLVGMNGSVIAEMVGFVAEEVDRPSSIQSLSYYETWEKYDLQVVPKLPACGSKKHISVFSWNEEDLALIEKALGRQRENVNVCQVLLKKEFNQVLDILDYISTQTMSVIFAPGVEGLAENMEGEHLFETIRLTTTVFLTILKALFKHRIHIIVITNETQPCSLNKTKVIGAELWGMVRSVVCEGTALSFTLLDIDSFSEFALDSVIQIATDIDYKETYSPREYAVRGRNLYQTQLSRMPKTFYRISEKQSLLTNLQCVRICHSSQTYNDDTLFGIPLSEAESNYGNVVNVTPDEALRCDAYCFPTMKNDFHFDLSGTKCIEHEIRICEVAGKAEIGEHDVDVIACCDTGLKTKLKIDKKIVFEKSSFKNYKTGYLHAVIISQALSDLVGQETHVVVDCSKKFQTIYHFLCLLLAEKTCKISFQELSSDKKSQNLLATDLVILSECHYMQKNVLQTQFPNLKRCISLKGTLPLLILKENDLIEFHEVDVEDLYQPSKLCVVSQKATRFLLSTLNRCQEPHSEDRSSVLNITEIKKQLKVRTNEDMLIKSDSAYIVVGGLSGLGWVITKHIAKKKPKRIITLSRRSPSMDVMKRIQNVAHIHDTEIIHREVDITKIEDLRIVMQSIQQSMPNIPIRGVFQGAGVLKDGSVQKITQDEFELPLRAKILGTWNLHLVTRHMNLDIFVMHSSVTSVFGSFSQTNYAAANAFEDSFAHYRKSLGFPAQTINWGALDVGMGSNEELKDIFSHKGFRLLSEKQIISCLTQMLLSDRTQCIFADFDLKKMFAATNTKRQKGQSSKFIGIVADDEVSSLATESAENTGSIFAGENFTYLVKQISAQVLLLDISEIEDTDTIAQFGLDSQNGVEIVNTIYSRTEVRVPILMLLSGAFTFQELGNHIKETKEENSALDD